MSNTAISKVESIDDILNESLNSSLDLKKNEGFQYLTSTDKAFLLCHLYQENNKAKAYAIATGRLEEFNTPEKRGNIQLVSYLAWKRIEKSLGGVRNIITLMGVDVVYITQHAKRLIKAQKMVLDKQGVEHYSDDGSTQIKALEFLAKLSGNYSEERDKLSRTAININFGSPPAGPMELESDNMEVVEGTVEVVDGNS